MKIKSFLVKAFSIYKESITPKEFIYKYFFQIGGVVMNKKYKRYIFTKHITVGGKRLYASDYGLKAFRIEVKD